MPNIAIFGAGKSASCLINYLGILCAKEQWKLLVTDSDIALSKSKTEKFPGAEAFSFDVTDKDKRQSFIKKADVVISMLPPSLHLLIARDCIDFSKHFLTASYIDMDLRAFANDIAAKNLLFIGEMGLDPGIDHMSAMKLIDRIKKHGGQITSFKSHCGGLMAPESDDNPWHYKISWNPANVVAAGSSGAYYKSRGKIKEVLYPRIFGDPGQAVDVPGLGKLAWYANRDSLSYIDTYGLHKTDTFVRTTLRYPEFCRGWNKLIHLGLTNQNDHHEIRNCKTFSDWFFLKLKKQENDKPLSDDFMDEEFSAQIDFIGLRSNDYLPVPITNSATLLRRLLEKNLAMKATDKDMVVLLHEIEYTLGDNIRKLIKSTLIVKGEDRINTAMAKTVGLPLGIAARLILENKIKLTGLHIPVLPEIYQPVLSELENNGITFHGQEYDV
ncbi:MAG: saccharopine dehydrogenase C-terminal domain-containing protein [Ginsengibacter sp.]